MSVEEAQTSELGEGVSPRQAEAILAGITHLPTLPAVASRLLSMGASEDVRLDEVIELIESDPALSARMLSLCRCADAGLGDRITTVRRAVIMLGLEAVRSAVLSVLIFDGMRVEMDEASRFDIEGFWTRAIAVACVSERIALRQSSLGIPADQAYLAGLVHSLGKLALYKVLPKSWEKALLMTERQHCSLGAAERGTIGIDHHTAGKRLAEHWGLPETIRDVIWLYGQPLRALPEQCDRGLVSVVTLANAWCEAQHLGWSGDARGDVELDEIATEMDFRLDELEAVSSEIVERVSERARILGVGEFSAPDLLFGSLSRANSKLASINEELRNKQLIANRSHGLLSAVDVFFDAVGAGNDPRRVVGAMVRSGASLTGIDRGYVIVQEVPGCPWTKYTVTDGTIEQDGESRVECPAISDAGETRPGHIAGMSGDQVLDLGALEWFREMIESVREVGVVSLIGVGDCGENDGSRKFQAPNDGVSCLVVLVRASSESAPELSAKGFRVVSRAWGRAMDSAVRAKSSEQLSEELASVNRELSSAHKEAARNESLLRLGQMAAGAAHEMNNPLSVINGRAQRLFERLGTQRDRDAVQAIARATDSLSSMITSMHLLAEPPEPSVTPTDPVLVVRQAIEIAKAQCERMGIRAKVKVQINGQVEPVSVDRELMANAISEPVFNAILAHPAGVVMVSIEPSGEDGRVLVRIVDTGPGLSHRALNHAFDPFFSELKAGRRPGLGLSRARSVIELHGGTITIGNTAGKITGAQVQIVLRSKAKRGKQAA